MLEYEKLKIKIARKKGAREPNQLQKNTQSAGLKKTFLSIDAILYPKIKEARTVDSQGKPIRRKTIFIKDSAVPDKPGLRGYGKSARKVAEIMKDKQLDSLVENLQPGMHHMLGLNMQD